MCKKINSMIYYYMNNQLKLLLYIVFIVFALVYVQGKFGFLDIYFSNEEKVEETSDEENVIAVEEKANSGYVEIFIPSQEEVRVDVEISKTETEKALGLSNRRYLGDYSGMLFVYDAEVSVPFWMKDMYIPLDIIFISSDGFIVDISEEREPCETGFCPYIYASSNFKYVLEVNSGFCRNNKISIGNSVVLHLDSE